MLGVCSSRRDQQFWLLNHSISSSYEEVMIKVSQWKSRTILQIFRFEIVQVVKNWREERSFKEGRRGAFLSNKLGPDQPCPRVGHLCHTGPEGWLGRVAHGLHTWWPGKAMAFGHLASPAHLSRSSAVFGHPNSDFESVFGLRIMTSSRTTTTMKLWQMVENSSQKTTTNTTQRMRTKSSVATSFGLEN